MFPFMCRFTAKISDFGKAHRLTRADEVIRRGDYGTLTHMVGSIVTASWNMAHGGMSHVHRHSQLDVSYHTLEMYPAQHKTECDISDARCCSIFCNGTVLLMSQIWRCSHMSELRRMWSTQASLLEVQGGFIGR
jgi:isoprenylcysteine carboxyl methyltransferase (ICMT) family protein YpbQ